MGTFIWCGKMERPQFGCSLRKMKEGGLGLIQSEPFLRAQFTRPKFELLARPDIVESSLLRYWLGFPLRLHLPLYKGNN